MEIDLMSEEEDERLFLERLHELHAQEQVPVTLTNIYKEIPISHPATICGVDGKQLELETCELQLAAISQCSEAYLHSPLLSSSLLGILCSIDIRRSLVKLTHFKKVTLEATRRKTVRVRLNRPMSVRVHADSQVISGFMHDISLGGTCIKTAQRLDFARAEKLEVEVGLVPESSETVLISSIFVHSEGDAPPYRCAFCFDHTSHTEQLLSVFINHRQLQILKELKESLL